MKILKIVVLSILLFVFSACAPEQGTIEKKDYDAAYIYWVAGSTTCSGTGTSRYCSTTPGYFQTVPENYGLYIVNGDDKGWVTVSREVYAVAHVGDYYDNGEISSQ